MFGLTSQLRRSALSVPTNIVEGYSRLSKNEFRHFLSIAYGSLAEAIYLSEFSMRRGFISSEKYASICILKEECSKLLWGLYASQRNR